LAWRAACGFALGANHQRLESLQIRAEREAASGFLFWFRILLRSRSPRHILYSTSARHHRFAFSTPLVTLI